MARSRLVVGIADHSGWAVLVCVSAHGRIPDVVDRRRVELVEPALPKHPYEHDTAAMPLADAERLVKEVQESAVHCAEKALSRLQSSLEALGDIVSIALREPPLAQLPKSVAEVRASYHVMTRADAMLYHDALRKAAASLGINVAMIKRGTERQRAAETLGVSTERLDQFLTDLRSTLGAPWQKDHQAATAYALATLGTYQALKLPD